MLISNYQSKMKKAGSNDSTTTIFFALGANLFIAVAKGVATWFTGSSSMLAEAVHSVADSANQIFLLIGLKHSSRPPSTEYPLGHGRAIYFWSFIVALMLFSMGGVFSIYEGIHKMGSGGQIVDPWIAISVLVVSIIAESISLWKGMKQVNPLRGTHSLWSWFGETRRSELLVVIGEDIAATFGLSIALLAVVATMLTGNPVYDALGSMAIGVLLLVVAGIVGFEVSALLVGRSAEPALRKGIRALLSERNEIAEVITLITLQNGNDVFVVVKARMTEDISARALVGAINRCESSLRVAFPEVRWIFFQPDLRT
jgi:cation diffusion facilitator family transporter